MQFEMSQRQRLSVLNGRSSVGHRQVSSRGSSGADEDEADPAAAGLYYMGASQPAVAFNYMSNPYASQLSAGDSSALQQLQMQQKIELDRYALEMQTYEQQCALYAEQQSQLAELAVSDPAQYHALINAQEDYMRQYQPEALQQQQWQQQQLQGLEQHKLQLQQMVGKLQPPTPPPPVAAPTPFSYQYQPSRMVQHPQEQEQQQGASLRDSRAREQSPPSILRSSVLGLASGGQSAQPAQPTAFASHGNSHSHSLGHGHGHGHGHSGQSVHETSGHLNPSAPQHPQSQHTSNNVRFSHLTAKRSSVSLSAAAADITTAAAAVGAGRGAAHGVHHTSTAPLAPAPAPAPAPASISISASGSVSGLGSSFELQSKNRLALRREQVHALSSSLEKAMDSLR